jgi:hypothetical protein
VVCDPLGGNGAGTLSAQNGLLASLSYLPSGYVGEYSGVEDFMKIATPISANLYFSQLDVPTEMFTQGFAAGDGKLLTDPQGNPLIQFFALRFQSVLQLSASDDPGYYQFAILSDDGSILYLDQSGDAENTNENKLSEFLSDDGDHPTTMSCASNAIYFDKTTQLPMRFDYFQGPKYNIALVLLWRKVGDAASCGNSSSFYDVACGQSGNDTFFNPNVVPSAPTSLYEGMLQRGWKPLNSGNYVLPSSAGSNPCVSPSPIPSPTVTATPTPTPTVTPTPTNTGCSGAACAASS